MSENKYPIGNIKQKIFNILLNHTYANRTKAADELTELFDRETKTDEGGYALPADDAVQNWFEENIDKECSASSAIYKFRLWLKSLQPKQAGAGREAIEDILLKTGRHNLEECSELADLILQDMPKQAEAVWVKYALLWSKDAIEFANKEFECPQSLIETWGNVYMNVLHAIDQALDEINTAPTELPTFWDAAKAFKWAAEYRDEKGGQLTLYNDQWTLISENEDGNENETEDLTPGNVAELYCLQNGFDKENGTASNKDAIEFAEWLRETNYKPYAGSWYLNGNNYAHQPCSTNELHQLWQQSKSKV